MNRRISPPNSLNELLTRAQALAGTRLELLAQAANAALPKNLLRKKGWVGQLLEWHLGADGGNQSQPDFLALGVELKTLPLNRQGKPKESTYVCTAPWQTGRQPLAWRSSPVYQKLARVLWIPLEADPNIPLAHRRILSPLLWEMTSEWEALLQQDWEELMEALQCGQADRLSAAYGSYLQIRPKAANSRARQRYFNDEGNFRTIVPKGFYLRTRFTEKFFSGGYLDL